MNELDQVRIHLSYFHEFLMRDQHPDVAEQYDDLHRELKSFTEALRVMEKTGKRIESDIENLIATKKLKNTRKPANYDSDEYLKKIIALKKSQETAKAIADKALDDLQVIRAERLKTMPKSNSPSDLRTSMLELINNNKPR